MNIEGIGETHEEIEECAVIHSLGNLGVGPSSFAQGSHLFIGDLVRVAGQRLDELEEQPVSRRQASCVEVATS